MTGDFDGEVVGVEIEGARLGSEVGSFVGSTLKNGNYLFKTNSSMVPLGSLRGSMKVQPLVRS